MVIKKARIEMDCTDGGLCADICPVEIIKYIKE